MFNIIKKQLQKRGNKGKEKMKIFITTAIIGYNMAKQKLKDKAESL